MEAYRGTSSPRFYVFQVSILPRPNQLRLCQDSFKRFNTQCLNETNPQHLVWYIAGYTFSLRISLGTNFFGVFWEIIWNRNKHLVNKLIPLSWENFQLSTNRRFQKLNLSILSIFKNFLKIGPFFVFWEILDYLEMLNKIF